MACPEGEQEANLARAAEGVREAAGRGTDLVVLPELWASGYDLAHADRYAASLNQGAFAYSAGLARDHKIWLTGSLLERGDDGAYYNTAVLWDPDGAIRAMYRKVHLFRLMDEDRYLRPGDQALVFELPWGRTALAICYDLRFPELFRRYALSGAVLTIVPAQWPRTRVAHWQVLLRARAIENQMFVIGCNRVGSHEEFTFGGRSAVVDPWGEVLVEGDEEAAVLTAELDMTKVARARRKIPVFEDRRPEVYGGLNGWR
ncbi:MAG TPA: carbon-nitrogen family hydrolase [Caldilineae bacterium]|nr:carbon-nitrogen family hydrolase [Caldilineae bacterium]